MWRTRLALVCLSVALCSAIVLEVEIWRQGRPSAMVRLAVAVKRRLSPTGWSPPPVIYGHVHMAKTGGTSLNGMLALRFERVCGHKGYSFDYAGVNSRHEGIHEGSPWTGFQKWSRGRVPPKIMDQRGYEDCDYISLEASAGGWLKFSKWYIPVELHVPCRDPIDHLMSQCNSHHHSFDCEQPFTDEVPKCERYLTRYGRQLNETFSVKCYSFEQQFTGYLNYMSQRLQPKRKKPDEYYFRSTNKKRTPDAECIYSPQNKDLKQRLKAYLVDHYDYYKFCETCIGSKSDLLR